MIEKGWHSFCHEVFVCLQCCAELSRVTPFEFYLGSVTQYLMLK